MKQLRTSFPLVLATLLLAAAPASAESVMQQAESWVIAPIAGSPMCAMKNTWEDGRKLVFARDNAGINSIAVDFNDKVLQAGRQYPLTLDLPPVLTRETRAVAATSSVLLVGMGQDRAFYKALAGMQALYVTAEGRETGYDMAGSSDALQALAECAAGTRGSKTVATQAAPSSMKAALSQKLAAVEVEQKRLKADIVSIVEAEKAALEKKLAAAEKRLAATQESKNTGLEEKLAAAERHAAAMEAELAAARKQEKAQKSLAQKLAAAEERLATAQRKLEQKTATRTEETTPPVRLLVATAGAAGESRLRHILGAAGIVPAGSDALNWEVNGVLGSAEEGALGQESFNGKVEQWLSRMSSRCAGDFAHTATPAQSKGGVTVQKAEMACIGNGQDAAAALVFIGADGKFSTVIHESATEGISTAIARRDAVATAAYAR